MTLTTTRKHQRKLQPWLMFLFPLPPTSPPPPAIPCPPLQCQALLVIPDEGDASPKMTEKYVNVYSFFSCVASFYPEFLPLFVWCWVMDLLFGFTSVRGQTCLLVGRDSSRRWKLHPHLRWKFEIFQTDNSAKFMTKTKLGSYSWMVTWSTSSLKVRNISNW